MKIKVQIFLEGKVISLSHTQPTTRRGGNLRQFASICEKTKPFYTEENRVYDKKLTKRPSLQALKSDDRKNSSTAQTKQNSVPVHKTKSSGN